MPRVKTTLILNTDSKWIWKTNWKEQKIDFYDTLQK